MEKWTYGIELELGDSFNQSLLPCGATWNEKENAPANSIGIGVDPKGKLYPFGGEINTKPTDNIDEQVQNVKEVINSLKPKPFFNTQWTPLHVHIRVPGLCEDLEALKKIFVYWDERADALRKRLFPLAFNKNISTLMKQVVRKNAKWATYRKSKNFYDKIMSSKTPKEFFHNHASLDDNGRRLFHLVNRTGINLIPVFKETGTVEFRFFLTVYDAEKVRDVLELCTEMLEDALSDNPKPVQQLIEDKRLDDHVVDDRDLERQEKIAVIHRFTSLHYVGRKNEVKKRLDLIQQEINIQKIKEVDIDELYDLVVRIKEDLNEA